MANPHRRLAENAAGDFFVDATCIDCDTCRQLAPHVFAEGSEFAYVHHQPTSAQERREALQALVSCPTGSIGSLADDDPKQVLDDFPLLVEDPVYYCGFTSRDSFGGSSYFIRHAEGNWLVDSPKYLPRLVKRFEELGGIAHIFLTHQDDVADAERFAAHFGARRYIHEEELEAQPDAEVVLHGEEPSQLASEFAAIPTPGHTAGHTVLLFRNRFLFTGDHLYFNRDSQRLGAFRNHCWFSWPRQIESMRQLAAFDFEWVLPGHGQRVQLPVAEMKRQLINLVMLMQRDGAPNT